MTKDGWMGSVKDIPQIGNQEALANDTIKLEVEKEEHDSLDVESLAQQLLTISIEQDALDNPSREYTKIQAMDNKDVDR